MLWRERNGKNEMAGMESFSRRYIFGGRIVKSTPHITFNRPVHSGSCTLCCGQSLYVGGTLTNLEDAKEDAEEYHDEGLGVVPHTFLIGVEKGLQIRGTTDQN